MMPEPDAEVVIAGAGPAGLWLAGELRLAGVRTIVLERTQDRGPYTRGLGVHARTLEVLAMRGVADTPVQQGRQMPRWHFGMLPRRKHGR
jgi:2-polyprenyl-6-methoxyphenol hydroxylase-like FAD-dependent oxidoreductase